MTARLELGRTGSSEPLTIKADRFRTHGVIVGMTGSGKTGLGLVLLEELVASGVPIFALDPKGDLGNLGLLFPEFAADDFAPWCGKQNPADAAKRWQAGLLKSGIAADRVQALRKKLALTVYTPGSTAGRPVDLLGMLEAPPPETLEDHEARTAVISAAVSGLLGLAGRKADPVKDPAHVTLSYILDNAWRAGQSLDLASLVMQLVDPPFEKVGVFPVDRFFSPDARMELAMAFNAILAAPSFRAWRQGTRLDPDTLLRTGEKTPVSVFNVAHLDDRQRQFFVALLLSRLLAWSRRQPGTEDLRAVLFFDEVAGYLPPYPRNPPSKAPLLTLMKQARAVGLGVVLSTQNPVDLDYKALSNAGVWCIGRLSTSQDRERLLKGIDGRDLDGTVAGLSKRQFLLHEMGRDKPQVFGTRHAMCYLRGPMTAVEVGRVNDLYGVKVPQMAQAPDAAEPPPTFDDAALTAPPSVKGLTHHYLDPRVAFSARLEGLFADVAEPHRSDGHVHYRPALYTVLRLRFDEDRVGFVLDHREVRVWFPLGDAQPTSPTTVRLEEDDVVAKPSANARFSALPTWMDEAKEVTQLRKSVIDDVYRTETRGMFVNKPLKLYGRAKESREDFEARCREAIENRIDEKAAKLKDRYETKADRLDDRISTKKAQLAELQGVARSRQLEEAVNIGAAIMSFFGGRKRSLTSVVSKRRQSSRASSRVDRLESEIERLAADAVDLEAELTAELDEIRAKEEAVLDALEEREVRLEKNDIEVSTFGVLWVPVTRRV